MALQKGIALIENLSLHQLRKGAYNSNEVIEFDNSNEKLPF